MRNWAKEEKLSPRRLRLHFHILNEDGADLPQAGSNGHPKVFLKGEENFHGSTKPLVLGQGDLGGGRPQEGRDVSAQGYPPVMGKGEVVKRPGDGKREIHFVEDEDTDQGAGEEDGNFKHRC